MPSASEALVQVEFGQNPSNGVEELTNAGDNINFYSGVAMGANRWSDANGRSPTVVIDGVVNGGYATPSTTVDTVNVSAALYNVGGVAGESIVSSTDLLVARPSGSAFLISAITITAAGAWAVVAGAEGSAFVSVRGDPGGPPLIPVGDIELNHVRYSAQASAVVGASEIQSIDGVNREPAKYPFYEPRDMFKNGGISFSQEVPAIHVGVLPKGVYAQYFTPVFGDIPLAKDFTPPSESATVNSEEWYRATLASISRSLSAGSYTQALEDGITDPIMSADRDKRWMKFFPNINKPPFYAGQGIFAIVVSYPADDNITAEITIAPETIWDRFSA